MSASSAPVRRVLICDDSVTYAAALSRLLQCDPAIEVVEVCPSAETAIARLSQLEPRPDLVTMDLELPGMSGGEAIEHIMSVLPLPILALAGSVRPGSREARAALAAGALDAVPKEGLDLLDLDGPRSQAFRRRVKVLAGVPVIRHPRAGLGHGPPVTAATLEGPASIIGVAASAGGPQALAAVLTEVPATFPIPILVVQHMVDGFGEGFARWLDGQVPLAVRVARNRGAPEPGIWIAPDGAHLTLDGAGGLMLDTHRVAGLHRPSADVLLRSLAARAGSHAVAVVLTGMGRDGAEGLGEVRRAGGLTIAQDEATSSVFGMPKAAIERGAQLILGPGEIGRLLRALRPVARGVVTSALDEVASLIQRESGIRFAAAQHPFLQAALGRIGPDRDPVAFLRRASDPSRRTTLVAKLIDEVTVKETSFLRDRPQLERIDWRLMLRAARACGAERLRVWTAPCATGEEAYSLALLACEAFAPVEPPVTIFATDISGDALAHARAGAYRSRSAREVEPVLQRRYFHRNGEQLVVGDRLRSLVTFAGHNLTRDPFPPSGEAPFHLILCRNVLIYFDTETVARVVSSLERALTSHGTLVLGVADVLCRSTSQLAATAERRPMSALPLGALRRPLRRPLGRLPEPPAEPPPWDEVIAHTSRLLAEDPLNAETHFHRGLAQLEHGDPSAAVSSLRRALYIDSGFGLAAFTLGSAHEALGERSAARRAYERALRTLRLDERHQQLLGRIDLSHITAAARDRLQGISRRPG